MTHRVKEFTVYIGQPVRVLVDVLHLKKMTLRQIMVDGESSRYTMDIRSDRLNIDSENGIVTSIRGIY